MSTLTLGVPFAFAYEMFILSFYGYPNKEIHITVGLLFLFQVFVNFVLAVTTDSSMRCCVTLVEESSEPCNKCRKVHVARTHTCRDCDRCIIRRDHHCWFIGCCVGAMNYRYFICLLFYVWCAAFYCNVFNIDFVMATMEGNYFFVALCHIAPQFLIVTGCLTVRQSLIAMLTFIGFGFLIVFSCLLFMQLVQFRRGQTYYERKVNIVKYDHGFVKNVRHVFGDSGIWAVFIPFLKSDLDVSLQICEK